MAETIDFMSAKNRTNARTEALKACLAETEVLVDMQDHPPNFVGNKRSRHAYEIADAIRALLIREISA